MKEIDITKFIPISWITVFFYKKKTILCYEEEEEEEINLEN